MTIDTFIVTEQPALWQFLDSKIKIISAIDYLSDDQHIVSNSQKRIINLCRSYQYQSTGYYVSLLAEARGQRVFPSVMTIQDIKATTVQVIIDSNLNEKIQQMLKPIKSDTFELSIYFGNNMAKRYSPISRKLYGLLPLPLFRVYFKHRKNWVIQRIDTLCISEIPSNHYDFLIESAHNYFSKKRYYTTRQKTFHYDLAILHNSKEKTPPSNAEALKKFAVAGAALGINVDFVGKESYKSLLEYDALFIRETTAVNHHTYRFSRKAFSERLVVLDDPISILRCTNKVYLAELLQKHRIKTPKTTILSKQNWKEKAKELDFPCVLKQPDGSFSQGMIRVKNYNELADAIINFFKSSELIICQEFMASEFDWRIGILNHEPLFACRYYMAEGHWQIYNWQSNDAFEGNNDTLPIKKVPEVVLKTAIRASKLIGSGLYGVDLKQIDDVVYVIEINDNPNIDGGVEDLILGDELYQRIMKFFSERLKHKHGYK